MQKEMEKYQETDKKSKSYSINLRDRLIKILNVNIEKKLSNFISELCLLKVKLNTKSGGLKDFFYNKEKVYYCGWIEGKRIIFSLDIRFVSIIASNLINSTIEIKDNITEIEKRVFISIFLKNVMKEYIKIIFNINNINDFSIGEIFDPIEYVFDGKEERCIYSSFNIEVENHKHEFEIFMPYQDFKKEFESIDIKRIMENKDEVKKQKIDLRNIPIELKLIFAKQIINIKDFLALKKGDLIKINKNSFSEITILLKNGRSFKGILGKNGDRLAIKITEFFL